MGEVDKTQVTRSPEALDIPVSHSKPNSTLFSTSAPGPTSKIQISDDSSSSIRNYDDDSDEEESDDHEDVGADVAFADYGNKRNNGQPITFSSSSSGSSTRSASPISPTAVYSTMLNANNIVNNSIALQPGTTRLPNPPTLIEYEHLRFLIMDAPSQSNLRLYLREMKSSGVQDIVRVCEPTYPKEIVAEEGIKVHDWVFPDGESPPSAIIDAWLDLVEARMRRNEVAVDMNTLTGDAAGDCNAAASPCIAVHCVAGLGRAPVLVAIALIEFTDLKPLDAVMFIRQRRRGAINNKQLKSLETYQLRRSKSGSKCVIM